MAGIHVLHRCRCKTVAKADALPGLYRLGLFPAQFAYGWGGKWDSEIGVDIVNDHTFNHPALYLDGGGSRLCKGKNGEDICLDVPVGTVAKDAETGEILFELLEPGEEKILVKGGRGGLGNNNFKSATNQTPRYAQPGEPGTEGWFILELKVLADVGLVGFPNAGKSTLLSTVSAAKPKIANYPFTTLEPNLGIVSYYDDKSFVMADIPGIIEGAHLGKGIGLRFLRHIERNSILLFLIPADSDDIAKEYGILLNELKEYNPELLVKNRILAVSKSDMLDEKMKSEMEASLPEGVPHIFFSSMTGENIKQLKDMLWETLHDENK